MIEKIKKDKIYIIFSVIAYALFSITYIYQIEKRTMLLDIAYIIVGIVWTIKWSWLPIRAIKKYRISHSPEDKSEMIDRIAISAFWMFIYFRNVNTYILSTKVLY